ncbi:hypothetical protein EMIHUDRAFT_250246 [Emiliania huxleyi CCMP1516]|uniref:Fe2OG dioxygenase domain-containing protein n=2 Tax=Emiliania huxleyi TaxID=2903 RepID=A0A0D3I2Q8_EMIH1|nr:hypothetical protein EMIHUDRAFT_250246 [Emiliania huxleyi CCMP1516]EOD05543.1 hypothetical protein EMIHUDRAFT_250246 [Emiliania huxleyi CCMP1516]|eukprot:XP_005757972.1 hypothetical protein EMIHUDRAFT_250246 [Emiliania huxleyi CCMP1516]
MSFVLLSLASALLTDGDPRTYVADNCEDRAGGDQCRAWASEGECEENAGFMLTECAASCSACTCSRPNQTAAVEVGGIGRMFERIVQNYPQFAPHVVSRDPWVLVLENFVSPAEAEAFNAECSDHWQTTMNPGQPEKCQPKSLSCDHHVDVLEQLPVVQQVKRRISGLTMTPMPNLEKMHVQRYEVGMEFTAHHDQVGRIDTPEGMRTATLVMYTLEPEEGGGTTFKDINYTVEARLGRAVLFANLMDANVSLPELLTHHEGSVVQRGTKVAVSQWIRQYDWRTPNNRFCRASKEAAAQGALRSFDYLNDYLEARRAAGLPHIVPLSLADDYGRVTTKEATGHVERGTALLERAMLRESILPLRRSPSQQADDEEEESTRAMLLEALASFRVALSAIEAFPKVKPQYSEGAALLALGDHEAALPALRRAQEVEGGLAPLCIAASLGHELVVRFLLREGADVEERARGLTPLFYASLYGRVDVARRLVVAGAQVDRVSEGGGTPLQAAKAQKHWAVVQLLRIAGALG